MAQRCNIAETGLGHTSAVGLFPNGRAQCGAVDMAGNVLEWCLTQSRDNYQNYETKAEDDLEGHNIRVLRGGSWSLSADSARCAFRLRLNPGIRNPDLGFRLVASPFVSGH